MVPAVSISKRTALSFMAAALVLSTAVFQAPASAQLSHEHAAELALDAYVMARPHARAQKYPHAKAQGWKVHALKVHTADDETAVYGFVGIRANRTHVEHAVVLRGTVDADDWFTNLSMELSPLKTVGVIERAAHHADIRVHKGMYERAQLIMPLVRQLIRAHSPSSKGKLVRNYYFGHSLGGGLASILAFEADEPVSQLVTFGAAEPGNGALRLALDKKISEQTHYVLWSDLIPSVSSIAPILLDKWMNDKHKADLQYVSQNTKRMFPVFADEAREENNDENFLSVLVGGAKAGHGMDTYLRTIREGESSMGDLSDFLLSTMFEEDSDFSFED